MINLQELEKEIDELLANETPQSLLNWLKSQPDTNINCYLGSGSIINAYEEENFSIIDNEPKKVEIIQHENNNVGNKSYAMAA